MQRRRYDIRGSRGWALLLALVATLTLAACGGGSPTPDGGGAPPEGDPNCSVNVFAAVSPEKKTLFVQLATRFRESPEGQSLPQCANIIPREVSSGEGAELLEGDWPTARTVVPRPAIWSPASTSWTDRVAASKPGLIASAEPFASSPLVFAMPKPMAETLGWPGKPVGFKTIEELCRNPEGWGSFGGAAGTWGPFRLAKTSPETSTSGLHALLGQSYAASGKTTGLTEQDVTNAKDFSASLEKCVIHYGDTTGSILQRMYDRDNARQALTYVSAVAVEETSVIAYNRGDPTSKLLGTGQTGRVPNVPLVAVYPEGGSLFSDNPVAVLNASWVTPEERRAAEAFQKFVLTPAAQALLGDAGFRPADPTAAPGGLITAENGVNPALPAARLDKPSNIVTLSAQAQWQEIRKPATVMVLYDSSGSMGYEAGLGDGRTRNDVARESAQAVLPHFRTTDRLGFWVFTTDLTGPLAPNIREIQPVDTGSREYLKTEIGKLEPARDGGTPLYDAVDQAYQHMKSLAAPGVNTAIVVLSDGEDRDSRMPLNLLLERLRGDAERSDNKPVRIFPIAFSPESKVGPLADIAAASGGQVFDATDPRRLDLILKSVARNF